MSTALAPLSTHKAFFSYKPENALIADKVRRIPDGGATQIESDVIERSGLESFHAAKKDPETGSWTITKKWRNADTKDGWSQDVLGIGECFFDALHNVGQFQATQIGAGTTITTEADDAVHYLTIAKAACQVIDRNTGCPAPVAHSDILTGGNFSDEDYARAAKTKGITLAPPASSASIMASMIPSFQGGALAASGKNNVLDLNREGSLYAYQEAVASSEKIYALANSPSPVERSHISESKPLNIGLAAAGFCIPLLGQAVALSYLMCSTKHYAGENPASAIRKQRKTLAKAVGTLQNETLSGLADTFSRAASLTLLAERLNDREKTIASSDMSASDRSWETKQGLKDINSLVNDDIIDTTQRDWLKEQFLSGKKIPCDTKKLEELKSEFQSTLKSTLNL
jgi:hypothetical protein